MALTTTTTATSRDTAAPTGLDHPKPTHEIHPSLVLRPCATLPDRMPHDPESPGHRPRLSDMHLPSAFSGDRMALFAGRLGGNQSFVLDRSNPANAELLQKVPDAAPNLSLRESFNLRGFREVDLYKAALIEFVGECFLASVVGVFGV